MSSSSEFQPEAENSAREQTAENATSCCRRKKTSKRKRPRRYVMALWIFALLIMEILKSSSNINALIFYHNPPKRNWKLNGLPDFFLLMEVVIIFANFLGGPLIYQFSSYKIILVSVFASSILHMLTPFALNHDSATFLLIVTGGVKILSIPIYIASLSVWKDWAPPAERTRLVTISLSGIVLENVSAILFQYLIRGMLAAIIQYKTWYLGVGGIVWVYLWYNSMSDTPQNDPLILEDEFRYLESTIPSNYQEKVKLRDVPWKSIAKSKQVIILCLIFFKIAFSVQVMQMCGTLLFFNLSDLKNISYILFPFLFVFYLILIGTSFLMDFLLRKYKEKTLTIRITFLCTGFGLQSLFLFGAIFSHVEVVKVICYGFGYSFLALSIPGVLTYPFKISPRYVPILAGIGFAFFSLGILSFIYAARYLIYWTNLLESRVFLIDGIMSLCIAIIIGIWDTAEEEPWSLLTSSHRASHDNRSDSQPNEEVELDLVS